MSAYQELKLLILDLLPFSRDLVHVLAGLLLYGVSITVLRRSPSGFASLALGVVASCIAEMLDLRDDVRGGGAPRFDASLRDLIGTNLAPAILVLVRRWRDSLSKIAAPPRL